MKFNRIALITSRFSNPLSKKIWQGVCNVAEKNGSAVHTFAGEAVKALEVEKDDPANKIYTLRNDQFDGVIVYGGAIGQFLSNKDFTVYCQQFRNLPTVCIGTELGFGSSVVIDNYKGLYDLISHLIKDHNKKNIAFVKGPEGHPEAEERFEAYKKALIDNNIKFNPDYIAPGEFDPVSGQDAVKLFLDKRKLKIDAISAVDDDTIFGVFTELSLRNIKIPNEIAITGFDNIEQTEASTPSITTIRQPMFRQGVFAAEELFKLIEGNSMTRIVIPTEVVLRESCGCVPQSIKNMFNIKNLSNKDKKSFNFDKAELTEWMEKAALKHEIDSFQDDLFSQFKNLTDSLFTNNKEKFINTITYIINKCLTEKITVDMAHDILTESSKFFHFNGCNENLIHRDALIHGGRILIARAAERSEFSNRLAIHLEMSKIEGLIRDLNFSFSLKDLWAVFKNELPGVGVTSFYICEYTDEYKLNAALMYGFSEKSQYYSQNYKSFEAKTLLPEQLLKITVDINFIAVPLVFSDEQLGYMLFDLDENKAQLSETLRWQVSAVIKRLKIMSDNEEVQQTLLGRNHKITKQLEPMTKNVTDVTAMTLQRINMIRNISSIIEDGTKKIQETDRMINGIADNVINMQKIIGIINDISESIHVLAINAAIQSSHAGSFGKAFAVIAKEIRKLADSTAKNAKEISDSLNKIIPVIQDTSEGSKHNMSILHDIDNKTADFLNTLENISERMKNIEISADEIRKIM